jgi:hypothetical protein
MMAANEAVQEGYGGISRISRVCGLSRDTITKGIRDLGENPIAAGRIRRPGGGRHTLVVRDPELPQALETLVEPLARGDPQSPLRWTCKSTRTLVRVSPVSDGAAVTHSDGMRRCEARPVAVVRSAPLRQFGRR